MSEQRSEFQNRVAALVADVKTWVEPQEWVTKNYEKKIRDADGDFCVIPALYLQKGPTRLLLDPVAYDAPGSQAVVDLYLMPTYDDMASLYYVDGRWTIHYPCPPDVTEADSTLATELPLDEQGINQVLDSIAAHAAPSF